MSLNDDIIYPDFSQKETSFICEPSFDTNDLVQTVNCSEKVTSVVGNQMIRALYGSNENPYEGYIFTQQIEKHIAEDTVRAQRENNQETYYDAGFFLAKGYRDYLNHFVCTPLTDNSFDIVERISICGEKFALFNFKTMYQAVIPAHKSEKWFREEEFKSDLGVDNFITENMYIVNKKIYRKEAVKGIRNIINCKLRSVPIKEYSRFGWNNADIGYFYFDGLKKGNIRGLPAHFIFHNSKSQMELKVAVQCLQNALKSNPYLQNEMSCAFLISMQSIVISLISGFGDKAPVVILHSRSAQSLHKIEGLFKYNKSIPTWSCEDIFNKSKLEAQYISDDALIVDVISHKNSSQLKQLSQGRFVNNVKIQVALFLVHHDFDDLQPYYDWALNIDDLVVDPSVGIALDRLKHEIIMQIEQKRISIDGLRTVGGDLFSFCESFLSWIGTENVYDELTGPLLKILTTGLKALEEFDGVNLIADILKQKLKFFTKTSTSASYIEKDREYYIPTALFNEICEMLSLKPLAAKKALRLRGGLRVYNSTRLEYTVDITDPVSRKRVKAVAITKSFLLGGEKSE